MPEASEVQFRPATRNDLPAVHRLLEGMDLPAAGVEEWIDRFWLGETPEGVVGVAGIEVHGDAALLRSVAVAPAWRGSGIAAGLVNRSLNGAREAGAREMFLLTTTAEGYFPRYGFTGVAREDVPPGIRGSIEFREACPATAAVMRRVL